MSQDANKKSYVIRTPDLDDDAILESGVSLISYLGGWFDAQTGARSYEWHIVCDESTLAWVLLKTGGTLKRK